MPYTSQDIYFIGVDGGATKSRVRLTDSQGTVLGYGESGPANIRSGILTAWENIMTAVALAIKESNLTPEILSNTMIGLGLAGVINEEDKQKVIAAAPKFKAISVAGDYHTACIGAFNGQDGAIQIIGTGSSGYALIGGIGHQVGGWGFPLRERVSGAALGRDGIVSALEAHDKLIEASEFTRALLDHFGGPTSIIDWSQSATARDYGTLAPLVIKYAALGDPVAITIVNQLAIDLERFVQQLIKLGAPKVCLVGGLASHIEPYITQNIRPYLSQPEFDAIYGAIHMMRMTKIV